MMWSIVPCDMLNCASQCVILHDIALQYVIIYNIISLHHHIQHHISTSPYQYITIYSIISLHQNVKHHISTLHYTASYSTWLPCAGTGYGASSEKSHTIVAAAIDALHTALVDPEHCKHLLLNTHHVTGLTVVEGSLHPAIDGLKACPPAQMTAGACLARLCSEVTQKQGM